LKYFVLNRGDDLSQKLTDTFHRLAGRHQMIYDENEPDIVLSIGGDGTMLHAFHSFKHRLEDISFVGIHTGHLGFYADWKADEIEQLVELMAGKPGLNSRKVEYPIAEVTITTPQGTETYLALNEVTLKGAEATLVAQLHINDQLFEMFRGDGIVISTPSGSTAYNKSLGGAIIHPALDTIQIAEIASINNRVFRTLGSSLILPQHHHCDIYPRPGQKLTLTVDHLHVEIEDLISIRGTVAKEKVSFARYRPFPFWKRVKDAFIGDVDK
jgi:NAD+ kinase